MNSKRSNKISRRLTAIPLILGFVILPLLIFGCFKMMTSLKPQVLVEVKPSPQPEKENAYSVKQVRLKSQKEILFSERDQRMELKLFAANSQMLVDKKGHETKIVERMMDVICFMQEELYYILADGREAYHFDDQRLIIKNADVNSEAAYISKETQGIVPMQIIRFMEADVGIYDYKSDLFSAENVRLERFIVKGHELTSTLDKEKKIMSGIADSIEFSLAGKKIDFKANKLKACFYDLKVNK